jgi:alkylglycerol monooxygenase
VLIIFFGLSSGRNRYCIDKNYASVFILWDRLFGTFAPEGEKIHFGLTHPIRSFDPTHLQLSHYRALVKRLKETSGLKNKVSVIIKGPGWDTGKPRLGLITDIPDVKGDSVVEIFNPSIPCHMQLYCALHFFVMLYFHVQMTERSTHLSHTTTLIIFSFIFTSLTSLGAMMEGQSYSERLELFRCWFFVFIEHILLPTSHYRSSVFMTIVRHGIKLVYFVSLLILMIRQLTRVGLLQKLTKDIRIRIK